MFGNFSRHNQIKIYTKTHQTAPHFKNFLWEHMPQSPLAYACNYNIIISIMYNSHFVFKILSKYTPKRINRKMLKIPP